MRLSPTISSLEIPAAFSATRRRLSYSQSGTKSERKDAAHPDRCHHSRPDACRADGAPRGATNSSYRRLRRKEEGEESEGAEGRIPEGRARHRPERSQKVVICPSPRS